MRSVSSATWHDGLKPCKWVLQELVVAVTGSVPVPVTASRYGHSVPDTANTPPNWSARPGTVLASASCTEVPALAAQNVVTHAWAAWLAHEAAAPSWCQLPELSWASWHSTSRYIKSRRKRTQMGRRCLSFTKPGRRKAKVLPEPVFATPPSSKATTQITPPGPRMPWPSRLPSPSQTAALPRHRPGESPTDAPPKPSRDFLYSSPEANLCHGDTSWTGSPSGQLSRTHRKDPSKFQLKQMRSN